MDTLVRLKADEINYSIVDFIKSSFKGKRIALHIYEDQVDETDYLLSDPTHKAKLLKTIQEVEEGRNMKTYTMEDLQSILNEPAPLNTMGLL